MVDIDIDASELDDAADNLLQLGGRLKTDEQELESELASDMKDDIETSIRKNFENVRTGKGTSLLDAFYIRDGAFGTQITTAGTGADHALPLEQGISAHPIKGDPWLAFQPENIDDYPKRYHADNGSGYVIIDEVMWKPDKQETATGYKYVLEAQQMWEADVIRKLPQTVQESIMKSGFKRSV